MNPRWTLAQMLSSLDEYPEGRFRREGDPEHLEIGRESNRGNRLVVFDTKTHNSSLFSCLDWFRPLYLLLHNGPALRTPVHEPPVAIRHEPPADPKIEPLEASAPEPGPTSEPAPTSLEEPGEEGKP